MYKILATKSNTFNILILITDVIRLENENGLVMASKDEEDLSIWMRTSSCLDVQEPFQNMDPYQYRDGLPKGNYTITIQYREFFFRKKVLR